LMISWSIAIRRAIEYWILITIVDILINCYLSCNWILDFDYYCWYPDKLLVVMQLDILVFVVGFDRHPHWHHMHF
jgi:hypothetical protein